MLHCIVILHAYKPLFIKYGTAVTPWAAHSCSAWCRAWREPASRLTDGPLPAAWLGALQGDLARGASHGTASSTPFGTALLGTALESSGGSEERGPGRAAAGENGRCPSPLRLGGGRKGRWERCLRKPPSPRGYYKYRGAPRGEGGGSHGARAGPYYRSRNASRRPVAPLGEAGSYLNPGSEENGGERLSVGETGRRRRSWALAPFPGEWGLEGGSNEWREESSSSCSPASSAGVGLGWGREGCPLPGKGAAWGWPWGAALFSPSRPPPQYGCVSLRGGGKGA